LEQLVTTQSAITAGVTLVTLRDREVALRSAVELASGHLSNDQITAVNDAIFAISKTREGWGEAVGSLCGTGHSDMVLIDYSYCPTYLRPIFASLGADDAFVALSKMHGPSVRTVVAPLLEICATRLDGAIASLR
jgi:hypothetical protein